MINFDGELIGVRAARKLSIYIVSVVFVVLYIVMLLFYSIDICFVFTADITVANDDIKMTLTLLDYLTLLNIGGEE
ncbi:MAG: hypothetical protein JWQ85_255 [Mucilaginibacter sp.]|nr:hypothetical protein [Mucilaginibacter sp.]